MSAPLDAAEVNEVKTSPKEPRNVPIGATDRPRRLRAAGLAAVTAGLAFLFSAVICYVLIHHVSHTLHVKTDVVGWPVFYAFDPFRYTDYYYIGVILFPGLGAVGTAVLWWMARRANLPLPSPRWWPRRRISTDTETVATTQGMAGIVTRLLAVGGVFGFIAAILRNEIGYRVWRDIVVVAVLYAVVVFVVSRLITRSADGASRSNLGAWPARVNAIAAAATLCGIVVASYVSRVTVLSDHSVRRFPWFPLWAGVLVVVAAVIAAGVRLLRAGNDETKLVIFERRMVFLVAIPVAAFLVVSKGAGDLSAFGGFDGGGQQLGTVRLVQHGAFPWRDWVSIHGLLTDTLSWLIGPAIIQNSYWGAVAGLQLIGNPLCILALYYFAYAVSGGRWPLLVMLPLAYFQLDYVMVFFTFALWPLVLILLYMTTKRRSFRWSAALGVALLIQAVLGPETAYCIPAAGVAVLGCDFFDRDGRRGVQRFMRTAGAFAGGVAAACAVFIVLAAHHAVGDFIGYYTTFAVDHTLTGALPMLPLHGAFRIAVVAPLAAMFAAFALIGIKAWLRRRFDALDWVLVATTILALLYYPKFLGRADEHIQEVFAACIPFFIVLLAEVLRGVEPFVTRILGFMAAPRRLPRPANVGGLVLAAALLTQVGSLFSHYVESTPAGFRQVVSAQAWSQSIGYAAPGIIDPGLVNDMNAFLSRYLPADGRIFDFTNEPGFVYWVLPYMPSTPYYNVSTAIRQTVQHKLIADLKEDRPLFVIYAQGEVGQPGWDGIANMVRHYDVSRYILDNYHPFADVHGQVLYARNDATIPSPATLGLHLSQSLITTDLYFRSAGCDWNHTNDYLNVAPAGESGTAVAVTENADSSLTITPPAGHNWHDYRWIELDAEHQFSESEFIIQDRGIVSGEVHTISFVTSAVSPQHYIVPIGSCSQWYGYGSAPLQIGMTVPQQLASVRLLP